MAKDSGRKGREPIDLREELLERLRSPETRRRIADALITEASGGAIDAKTGEPKGGASTLKAIEMIRAFAGQELAAERAADSGTPDYSRMTDERLRELLASLDAGR